MLIIDLIYRQDDLSDNEYEYKPDYWFINDFKPNWFDDEVVRSIVEKIDKNEFIRLPDGKGVRKSNYIMNGLFGYVDLNEISTGSKSLILLYKTNRPIQTKTLGDNCIELLIWLGDIKDIIVKFDCLRPINIENSKCGVKLLQTNKIYNDNYELGVDMLKVSGVHF